MSAFESRERLVVVGHRGGRGEGWPTENTVAAFERAIDEGVDAIELDVRACATGEVVVFHDPDLKRMSDGRDARLVRDVPYLELATRHRVPLLRDVLALCVDRSVGVNVEIKYDFVDRAPLVRDVMATIDELPRADVIVSSFDPRILARARAIKPKTRVAFLTTTERAWSLPLARTLSHAGAPLVFAVHLERVQADDRIVAKLKSRGLHVGVWTVNDADEARAFQRAGVDWIITDSLRRRRLESA